MGDDFRQFGKNAYLNLAYRAILSAKRPLSPKEMLKIASEEGFMPSHLHGATPHKTLSARLAVYIRENSSKSEFYRTGPAQFFVRDLAKLAETPKKYKTAFRGILRSKSIRKENVLVAPRSALRSLAQGSYSPYSEVDFLDIFRDECFFMDREKAEKDQTVKQFVTFTLVHHERKLLVYRRGKFTTTSDRLKGQLSVGFGGHVNDQDFNLFETGGNALLYSAARELREELFLDDLYTNINSVEKRAKLIGYVNVDDSDDAEHHIAILVAFSHKSQELPKKGELSINQLSWLDLNHRLNDLSDYDLWSGMILQNIFQGNIRF